MSKMLSIAKYEYRMQVKRIAGWIVLLFVLVSSMMDCLPVASNMARIEFLGDIHYYVRRVFSFDGLILLFGILFLTAGRMVDDRKTRRRDLFMAAPIPFYIFTQGDLAKLIWQHPKYLQIHVGSACLNLAFMLGIGILAIGLVTVKQRFWRAE